MNNERQILSGAAAKDSGCLTPADLEAAAAGNPPAAIAAHLSECPHCRAEVSLFASFLAAEMTPEESAAVGRIEKQLRAAPPWREAAPARGWFAGLWARPAWSLGLAGLAAALTLGVWLRAPGTSPIGGLPVIEDTLRSGRIEGVSPAGDLARIPSSVRWTAVPGAARYTVQILDIEDKALWQGNSTAAELAIPAEAQVVMTPRKTLTWMVTAQNSQGAPLAASMPQKFRLLPDGAK